VERASNLLHPDSRTLSNLACLLDRLQNTEVRAAINWPSPSQQAPWSHNAWPCGLPLLPLQPLAPPSGKSADANILQRDECSAPSIASLNLSTMASMSLG